MKTNYSFQEELLAIDLRSIAELPVTWRGWVRESSLVEKFVKDRHTFVHSVDAYFSESISIKFKTDLRHHLNPNHTYRYNVYFRIRSDLKGEKL